MDQQQTDQQMDQQREARVEEGTREANAAERREPATEAEMRPDERAPAATHDLDADDVRARWASIQASFVDDPMGAVREADELTGATLEQLAGRHRQLRDELGRGSDRESQTELARRSLQNYRSLLQGMIGVDSAHHERV